MYKKLIILILLTSFIFSNNKTKNEKFLDIKNPHIKYLSSVHFLYMQQKEDNLTLATKNKSQIDDFNNKIINMKYKYKPGFAAKFALFIPKTSLNIFFKWKEIYSHTKKIEDENIKNLYSTFFKEGVFTIENSAIKFSFAKGKRNSYFDSLDSCLAQNFKPTKNIFFNLYGGVKGIKIKQKLHFLYENGDTVHENGKNLEIIYAKTTIKNTIKGMGPVLGIDSKWRIIKKFNFNFLINSQIAFALTRFNITYIEEDKAYDLDAMEYLFEELKLHEYLWVIRPNSIITFGIDYEKKWKKVLFNLKTYYEINHLWENNLTRKVLKRKTSYPNKGDFFLSGLGISASIKF